VAAEGTVPGTFLERSRNVLGTFQERSWDEEERRRGNGRVQLTSGGCDVQLPQLPCGFGRYMRFRPSMRLLRYRARKRRGDGGMQEADHHRWRFRAVTRSLWGTCRLIGASHFYVTVRNRQASHFDVTVRNRQASHFDGTVRNRQASHLGCEGAAASSRHGAARG